MPSITILITESKSGIRVKLVPDPGASPELWDEAMIAMEALRQCHNRPKPTGVVWKHSYKEES
jgi:hypothetical protein